MSEEKELELLISPDDVEPLAEEERMELGDDLEPPPPSDEDYLEQSEDEFEGIQSGYVVGIKDDNVFWKAIGNEVQMMNLLGLHEFAGHKLHSLLDQDNGSNLASISERLGRLQQAVQFLVQLLAQAKP